MSITISSTAHPHAAGRRAFGSYDLEVCSAAPTIEATRHCAIRPTGARALPIRGSRGTNETNRGRFVLRSGADVVESPGDGV